LLPSVILFPTEALSWLSYIKTDLIIATAEMLFCFQVVLYQNLLACKRFNFYFCNVYFIIGFLAVFSHGISKLQTVLQKLSEWNMEAKAKLSVYLADLDVKSSEILFFSAHVNVILAYFEKSGAEFKLTNSENCLQSDFFIAPKIKCGQVQLYTIILYLYLDDIYICFNVVSSALFGTLDFYSIFDLIYQFFTFSEKSKSFKLYVYYCIHPQFWSKLWFVCNDSVTSKLAMVDLSGLG
jgi:hypothetical protein